VLVLWKLLKKEINEQAMVRLSKTWNAKTHSIQWVNSYGWTRMRNQSSAAEYGKGSTDLTLCDLWCVNPHMYVKFWGSSTYLCQLSLEICGLLLCIDSKLFFKHWKCIVHFKTWQNWQIRTLSSSPKRTHERTTRLEVRLSERRLDNTFWKFFFGAQDAVQRDPLQLL